MNCQFCHKECLSLNDYYRCLPCKTEFRQHGVINMYFRLKNKGYFAQIYPTCSHFKFRVMRNDPEGEELLSIQHVPKINPSNVVQKIQNYLPFL